MESKVQNYAVYACVKPRSHQHKVADQILRKFWTLARHPLEGIQQGFDSNRSTTFL